MNEETEAAVKDLLDCSRTFENKVREKLRYHIDENGVDGEFLINVIRDQICTSLLVLVYPHYNDDLKAFCNFVSDGMQLANEIVEQADAMVKEEESKQ